MKKINFVSSRIRKKEFTNIINGTIQIVSKYDPVNIGVKPFYDALVDKQVVFKSLTNYESKHPLSDTIKLQRKSLKGLIKAMNLQILAAEESSIIAQQEHVLIVKPVVLKYFKTLQTRNIKDLEGSILDFLDAFEKNVNLVEAATGLGINSYIDELRLRFNSLNTNVAIRIKDNSDRAILRNNKAEAGVLTALSNLLKSIELSEVHNSALDYEPLIAELNELFAPFSALSRTRTTKSINAAIKKESVASSTKTIATEI